MQILTVTEQLILQQRYWKKPSLRGSPRPKHTNKKWRQNNYYPFGLQHQGYNNIANSCRNEEAEAYKFLNKEYEDSFALNVTETDYRHYDSALGRFNVMDMLSELAYDYTPYRYGFNNPVFFSDPSGLFENWYDAVQYMLDNDFTGTIFRSEHSDNLVIGGTGEYLGRFWENFYETSYTPIEVGKGGSSGGSETESGWKAKLSADFTNSYSSSGLRYFADWWDYNDLAGGTGGLIINGIGGENMGIAEIKGPYKHINVTDLPGFTAPGQNSVQKVLEGLTKLISLSENNHVRDWFKAPNNKVIRENSDTIWYRTKNPMGVSVNSYKLKNNK